MHPQCRSRRIPGTPPGAWLERLTDVAYPEVALNQKVKNLIQKLGEAIHESVSESEHIAGVVKNIREQGFDVLLMLEATIGLNEVDMDEAESVDPAEVVDESIEGPFTTHDLTFLKSLRISMGSEAEGSAAAE
ncbi:hypothetical protein [Granulicella sibirica]|uniref:Uncharacterized protein n=1 Tax=Granulicella sibirica TaxID=2479048 RepID=A0A4Q0T6I7_9BACT|nr:hypothetical protein [Granulicella sibirica]RXH57629.1 hypothetical protein GRAN_0939 [Granulicella sibirica]